MYDLNSIIVEGKIKGFVEVEDGIILTIECKCHKDTTENIPVFLPKTYGVNGFTDYAKKTITNGTKNMLRVVGKLICKKSQWLVYSEHVELTFKVDRMESLL